MLVLLVVLVLLGIGLAVPIAIMIVGQQSGAKKEARKMLAVGKVTSDREFRRISRILSTTQNDLEAADLWKKLQELKARPSS